MDKEEKPTDGVGATARVVEDGREVLVAALDDVLFEGAEKIEKKGVG